MTPGSPFTLQFFKYPDHLHWRHDTTWLGEDSHGVWLGAMAGSIHQRGLEPAKPIRNDQVHLIPRDDWWVFTFCPAHPWATHWIDTSTPATFTDERAAMVDLDLDVVRNPDGSVWIDDEDEFEDHQKLYGYPAFIIEGALEATERLRLALIRPDEPFGRVAESWLARLRAMS